MKKQKIVSVNGNSVICLPAPAPVESVPVVSAPPSPPKAVAVGTEGFKRPEPKRFDIESLKKSNSSIERMQAIGSDGLSGDTDKKSTGNVWGELPVYPALKDALGETEPQIRSSVTRYINDTINDMTDGLADDIYELGTGKLAGNVIRSSICDDVVKHLSGQRLRDRYGFHSFDYLIESLTTIPAQQETIRSFVWATLDRISAFASHELDLVVDTEKFLAHAKRAMIVFEFDFA